MLIKLLITRQTNGLLSTELLICLHVAFYDSILKYRGSQFLTEAVIQTLVLQ